MVQCNYTDEGEADVPTLQTMKEITDAMDMDDPKSAKNVMQQYVEMFEATVSRWEADKEDFGHDQLVVLYNLIENKENTKNIDTIPILRCLRDIYDDQQPQLPQGGDLKAALSDLPKQV